MGSAGKAPQEQGAQERNNKSCGCPCRHHKHGLPDQSPEVPLEEGRDCIADKAKWQPPNPPHQRHAQSEAADHIDNHLQRPECFSETSIVRLLPCSLLEDIPKAKNCTGAT